MATISAAALAGQLMAHAPTQQVIDALAAHADVYDPAVAAALEDLDIPDPRLVKPAHAPSTPVALALLADPTRRHLVINAPVTDPDVLAAMATTDDHDAQVAAAANPATPAALLDQLAEHAVETGNRDLQEALCASLDLREWLPRLDPDSPIWQGAWTARDKILTQLERRGDPDLTTWVYRTAAGRGRAMVRLAAYVLLGAARGQIAGVSAANLWREATPDGPALGVLIEAVHMIPDSDAFGDELAELIAEALSHGPDFAGPVSTTLSIARPMSQKTVDLLLGTLAPEGIEGVLHSHRAGRAPLSAANLARIIGEGLCPQVAHLIVSERRLHSRLSAEHLEALAVHVTDVEDVMSLLESPSGQLLTTNAVAALLRNGRRGITGRYLTGRMTLEPTLEVARLLIAEPGRSLDDRHVGANITSIDDLLGVLGDWLSTPALDRPGVAEIVDHAPTLVLELAADGVDALTAHLSSRVHDRFADAPQAWAALPHLAESVPVDTLTELLDILESLEAPTLAR